jgi:D-3-phosphoglycerate dehydrogenase
MPKIIFTTSSFDLSNFSEKEELTDNGFEFLINPHGKRLTEDQVLELLTNDVVAMVAGLEPLTENVLKNAKGLRVIVRCGIGTDNVDMLAASKLGIHVYNTPDAPTRSVAELTLAHILSLLRRIPECNNIMRKGKWNPLMGRLLANKTVGLIGYGRIGKMVAELLKAFDAEIIVYDIFEITPAPGIKVVSMDSLLSMSDIVSLHLPYAPETRHLIAEKELAKMKPSSLLVNVARGGLIDEDDLLDAIKSGHIAGVALDSFETEPYSGPLLQFDNVQVTAHMGSYAQEARSMMESEACRLMVKGLKDLGLL